MRLLAIAVVLGAAVAVFTLSGDAPRVQAEAEHMDAAAAGPPADPNLFDPAVVRPEEGSVQLEIEKALAASDKARALGLAEGALKQSRQPVTGRLHWLAARAAGDDETRMKHLGEIALSAHPLSQWARLQRAELLLERSEKSSSMGGRKGAKTGNKGGNRSDVKADAEAAAVEANLLREGWPGAWRARKLRALALIKLGRNEEAVELLRRLVRQSSSKWSAASIAMPLADHLAKSGDTEDRQEALRLYWRVSSRAPLSAAGREAEAKAKKVLTGLPAKLRKSMAEPPVEEQFVRGDALVRARRYKDAEALYAGLAKQAKRDAAALCQARLQQGRTLLLQRQRTTGAGLLAKTADKCPKGDDRAWARYYAGRAYLRTGEYAKGIEQYERLQAEAPHHRLADDAAYKAALCEIDADDEPAGLGRLRKLIGKYPGGDMRPVARFELARRARQAGKPAEALGQLDKLIKEGPDEFTEGMEGRALYWRARALADLGRKAEATKQYEEVIRSGPLSYYAQQAHGRLAELDPTISGQLLAELGGSEPEVALTFPKRPLMQRQEFVRALELLRVDEYELAQKELSRMGALGEKADRSTLWLVAALLHQAGAHPEAARLVRRRLRSFTTTTPRGKARAMWRIAYPRAYEPLIETVAGESGVPAAFIRAVAREESGFDPNAVSPAHAYGLIQLIVPTAKTHARSLGLASDPRSLRKPEINLRIGASFIKYLWQRYPSNAGVVPSAYNAGHGAADKWLRERSGLELDAWIESIPYPETQRYTRRVLQTYGVYSWLDTGKLLGLPRVLPAAGGKSKDTENKPSGP